MTTTNQQGVISKTSGSVAKKKKPQSIKDYIKVYEGEIAKALPKVMTPDRFVRIATSAVTNTPQLAQCTPKSFVGAMLNAAQLGLEPNTPLGQAYLIPFRNKGVMEAQFQIGAKGLVELAHRAGTNVEAHVVYENDEFTYSFGLHPDMVHKPATKDRGNPIAYYAVWRNGENFGFEVMSHDDVLRHARKYSKAYNSGPWQTNFEEMAKKTVIKKALKYAPLKSDIMRALGEDETIKYDISEDMSEVKNEFFDAEYEESAVDTAEENAAPETETREDRDGNVTLAV